MKVSYLVYEPVPNVAELGHVMERVAALGYHGVELVATHPPGYPVEEVFARSRRCQLRVGSPALGYMLDTIHMNIEERSVLQTVLAHGPRVRHFHLCESNGGPFGTGNLDFPRVLAALTASGYAHYVSVKVYRKSGWEEAA